MAQVITQPHYSPDLTLYDPTNLRIVFGDVGSHRMKKRRGLCRFGSGCCRRISSVTTSPKLFGVGRRSWGSQNGIKIYSFESQMDVEHPCFGFISLSLTVLELSKKRH